MRIGSLFSGYGGLDMAVESVFGATTAWVADIDPGPRKILAHRFPTAPNLGDVTAVDWARVEPVDIITGGFPCQPVSTAGRQRGDQDERWLWDEVIRAVRVLRPGLVVLENVRGLLTAGRGRLFGRVLGALADAGYDAQWRGLRAADVGACHGRWRVFVVAYPHDAGRSEQRRAIAARTEHPAAERAGATAALTLLPTPDASVMNDGETPETWLARRERVKATAKNGNGMGTPLAMAVQLLPTPGANLGDNGGPQHPDKRRAGGHSVSIEDAVHGLTLLPTPRASDGTKGGPNQSGSSGDLMLPSAVQPDRWGDYAAAIHRHERMLGRPAPSPTEPGRNGNPRLSARFAEWMMCLPDGWVTDVPGITRNEALRALGNGVLPQQAIAALEWMVAT